MAKKKTNLEDISLSDIYSILSSMRKELRRLHTSSSLSGRQVYTNDDVKLLLGISDKTLKAYRDEGKLGYSVEGRTYLYSRDDIDKFLENCHHEASASKPPQKALRSFSPRLARTAD